MNRNIRINMHVKKIMAFIVLLCIVSFIHSISLINIIQRMNDAMHHCILSAVDFIITVGGARFINVIILPLSVVLFYIFCWSNEFNYNYFIRMKNRHYIGISICFKLLVISGLFVAISYICTSISAILATDKFSCMNLPNSLINTELYYTSSLTYNRQNPIILILMEILISFFEVYSRSMIGIILYIKYGKMILTIIAIMGTGYIIPFRMIKYIKKSGFNLTYGTFYTELTNADMYLKAILVPMICIFIAYFIIIIVLKRKNYL